MCRYLLFLSLNTVTGLSSLFMAQLQNPVQKIVKLKQDFLAKEVKSTTSMTLYSWLGKEAPLFFMS